jgi:hypothetical protein
VGLLSLASASCAPRTLDRDVRTVAVLMPDDQSLSTSGAAEMWEPVEKAVKARGFVLVPRARVEAFYAEKRFTIGGEIAQYSPSELCTAFACDGLFYTTVTQYAKAAPSLSPTDARVALEARLVEGRTGDELWRGEGDAGRAGFLWRVLTFSVETLRESRTKAVAECFRRLPRARNP